MNQVEMIPNYDEKVMEPVSFLPKLPIMLLNGAEGIGTGFSSVIPSFNHKDIIKSMISFINDNKAKKVKPWVRNYSEKVETDKKGRILFNMGFREIGGKIYNALHFNFSSTDQKLDKGKKLNTDIWYDEKNLNWVKATFKKKGKWEYRLVKMK